MRNFIKIAFFTFCLVAVASCEDDPDPIVSANGFALRATGAPSSAVTLLPANDANTVVSLNWDVSNNGGITTVSTYNVEVAVSGTNFANAITANNGNPVLTNRTYDLKVGELNNIANQLPGYQCGQEMTLDVRIRSTLGSAVIYNAFVQYSSNVITLKILPYSTALPTMVFATSSAVTDATPRLAAGSPTDTHYEGYMWLEAGSYKFYKPDGCNGYGSPSVLGDDDSGAFNTLTPNGSGYQVNTAGFFLVRANLADNSYSVRPTTWNIYGSAKVAIPLGNTAMTYIQTENVWKVTANLGEGYGFKFRSNGSGTNLFILGAFNANSVGEYFAGPDLSYVQLPIPIAETATSFQSEIKTAAAAPVPRVNNNYTITLDLSSPRNYKYTITKN